MPALTVPPIKQDLLPRFNMQLTQLGSRNFPVLFLSSRVINRLFSRITIYGKPNPVVELISCPYHIFTYINITLIHPAMYHYRSTTILPKYGRIARTGRNGVLLNSNSPSTYILFSWEVIL